MMQTFSRQSAHDADHPKRAPAGTRATSQPSTVWQRLATLVPADGQERSANVGSEHGKVAALPRTMPFSFSDIPIRASGRPIQAALTVSAPGDRYEREADETARRVMRMEAPAIARTAPPAIQRLGAGFQQELAVNQLQRACTDCDEEELQRKAAPGGAGVGTDHELHQVEAKVDAICGGQPLSREQRAFFEPRFGVDFGRVRIYANGSADAAARGVDALAFTRGSDIAFRGGQYRPDTFAGRQLLAHELTHVVQQGAAPGIQTRSANESGEAHTERGEAHRSFTGAAGHLVQRWPGNGMLPPGDCDFGTYLALRGAVETAKAIVSTLGSCSPGDTCLALATKIATITAEIAARVALDTTCFKGGDTGHRQQVQDKINMVNRCYRFFTNSNCPQQLIEAMEAVVARAREVVAAAAMAVVAVAAVVALIAALILLVELIIAAGAAAAVAASAAAVMALLLLVVDLISSEGPPTA